MLNISSDSYSVNRKQKVIEGINILLNLFSTVNQQRLFPRNIMTLSTKRQVTVYSIKEMIEKFAEADYNDCRINTYPAFLNEAEEKDYENGVNLDIFTPSILFLDVDLNDFPSMTELDKTLYKILKHISKVLPGSEPLTIWSGRGYHIIILVKVNEALEHFEDFSGLTEKPSEELLRFAKTYLSYDKADKANNPAFRSCLLRVPYTLNSKCFDEGLDPEVKIIQKNDSSKPLPKKDNLLVEFMTFLSDRKLKENLEKERQAKLKNKFSSRNMNRPTSIQYVEKLLTIPIGDYRKNAISLILAPYCVNILNLSDDDSFKRIKQWALECNDVKSLKPSKGDFDIIIKYAVKRAKETGVKPLKFKGTLQHKNTELYQLLLS